MIGWCLKVNSSLRCGQLRKKVSFKTKSDFKMTFKIANPYDKAAFPAKQLEASFAGGTGVHMINKHTIIFLMFWYVCLPKKTLI